MFLSRSRLSRSAFTLIETLIASAIVAITATSIYYAFLRMNKFAVASRADTAAKIVLERAVKPRDDQRLARVDSPILTPSDTFKTFNPDTGLDSDGSVSLFTDPSSNTVITGTISRQVIAYPTATDVVPANKPLGDLYRVTFKLDFKVNKRQDEPVTTVYAYTMRASDK